MKVLYEHHMNQTLEQGTLPGIKRDIVRKQEHQRYEQSVEQIYNYIWNF